MDSFLCFKARKIKEVLSHAKAHNGMVKRILAARILLEEHKRQTKHGDTSLTLELFVVVFLPVLWCRAVFAFFDIPHS